MKKPMIENAFIVDENGHKVYTRKLHKTIEDAKSYCNRFGEREKDIYLNNAQILHVVNDYIISSIDISSLGGGMLYFSSVHILSKKIPLFE